MNTFSDSIEIHHEGTTVSLNILICGASLEKVFLRELQRAPAEEQARVMDEITARAQTDDRLKCLIDVSVRDKEALLVGKVESVDPQDELGRMAAAMLAHSTGMDEERIAGAGVIPDARSEGPAEPSLTRGVRSIRSPLDGPE